jgi:DNA polymerase III subunit epsilon
MNMSNWKRLEQKFLAINQNSLEQATRFYHGSFITIISFLLNQEARYISHTKLVELYTWAEHLAADEFAIAYLSYRVLPSNIRNYREQLDDKPPPKDLKVHHMYQQHLTEPPHPNIQQMFDKDQTILYFDLETTGLNVIEDRIVEICIIKHLPHDGSFTRFYSRINPQIPIPPDASNIHNIFDNDVKACPTLPQIVGDIAWLFRDAIIVGFNIHKYDMLLLQSELLRMKFPFNLQHRATIDLAQIYWRKVPQATSKTLLGAASHYTDTILQNAHSSYVDAISCAHILEGMLAIHDDLPKGPELQKFYFSHENMPRYDGSREDCIIQWNTSKTGTPPSSRPTSPRPTSPVYPPQTPPNRRPMPSIPPKNNPKGKNKPLKPSISSSASQGSTQSAPTHREEEEDDNDQRKRKLRREGAVIIQ